MNTTDYTAFVGLDWGDKTHAFALRLVAADKIETGTLAATAESFHQWLDQLRVRCDGQRVALGAELRRSSDVLAVAGVRDDEPCRRPLCARRMDDGGLVWTSRSCHVGRDFRPAGVAQSWSRGGWPEALVAVPHARTLRQPCAGLMT